jgi:hypothetical protein
MPREEHFGEQFGMSKREEREMQGRAFGEHLLDAMAQADGYQDYEHHVLEKRNREDELFRQKYEVNNPSHGRLGRVRFDPDYDTTVYEIKHPSGWKGVHTGMMMDLHHPKHGPVDLISYTDYSRHGLLSPATHEDWPDPAVLHADLDEFVKEQGRDYD